ncbi:MAG: phosphonopyruvate decarboxylase [Clostridia bacterium]|nr:phosphonopyruvate decarboxylase [Clostridia bacterium]
MQINDFTKALQADFYCGVPDSQLKALCDHLMLTYGIDPAHHIIAANEGNCTAIAAGYHLATGKVPVVYMQNSGEGNVINPVASLLNDKVYGIPCIFVIGWRGEPGVHDEPQHIYQGEVTVQLLRDMDIDCCIVDAQTAPQDIVDRLNEWQGALQAGKQVAFVVKKGALALQEKCPYRNEYVLSREEVIRRIVAVSGNDPIVCTTGKASRELFEIREANGQGHGCDFLTVGSMGHSSSIALGIALQMPHKKIWCIDGDGAALMHMGAMAVIGAHKPRNLVHILLNNNAHETVGGMPTVANTTDFTAVAAACGYPSEYVGRVTDGKMLDGMLFNAKEADCLSFLEIRCAIGSRADLGRPTTTARQNKESFVRQLRGL